jgi:hypothetical protein
VQEGTFKTEALFLNGGTWQHLGVISTLRVTTSGVLKIYVSYINILFMNLISESVVVLHQRETKGSIPRNTRIAKIGRSICGILWKFNPPPCDAAHTSFSA